MHHKNFAAASCGDISDRNQFDLRTSCPRRDSSLSNVQGTQSPILGLHVLRRGGGVVEYNFGSFKALPGIGISSRSLLKLINHTAYLRRPPRPSLVLIPNDTTSCVEIRDSG